MPSSHAFDFLSRAAEPAPDIVAVFGNDSSLRSWAIGQVSGDGDRIDFEGDTTDWSDLRDDLATASLFDMGGKKTIVVRDADKFLRDHRSTLEDYIAKPTAASRLVLSLDSLASNTRIYKSLDKAFLLVGCGNSTDRKKGVTAATRRKFVKGFIAKRHQCDIEVSAVDRLFELLGEDLGMIDTEVAKLALYLDPGGLINLDLVDDVVAGWQGKSIWQITDAIAVGNAAEAIAQLDKLLLGGQKPIALLPQIAWSLRRLGMATAVVQYFERVGRSWRVQDALSIAGIQRPADLQSAEKQLRGLGRQRASQLLPWLLDADLRLKGTHSAEPRDRFLLEWLVLRMARGA